MKVQFRQIGACVAATIVLIVMMAPGMISGQDIYPLLFEEMSELAEVRIANQQRSSSPQSPPNTGAATGSAQTAPPSAEAADEAPKKPRIRPGRAPKAEGRSLMTHQFEFQNWPYSTSGYAEYVVPGRLNIGDNNSAETDNRFIFRQNYYHNAIDSSLTNSYGTRYDRSDSVDQYTVGFEKTLGELEWWSIEVRLPLFGTPDTVFNNGFSTQDLSTGNLAMIAKRMIYQDDRRVVSAGLGLSVPTGDDANFIAGDELFTVKNRATHLAPFLATLWTPNDAWFFHGFLVFDVAASSNPIEYRQLLPGGNSAQLGSLTNQALFNLDLAAGRWWFRDPEASTVTAVSSLIELHYTSSFDSGDMVTAYTPANDVHFSNPLRSFDSLNATAGFDVEIRNRIHLRTAAVLPLQNSADRFFDAEFQTSINFLW